MTYTLLNKNIPGKYSLLYWNPIKCNNFLLLLPWKSRYRISYRLMEKVGIKSNHLLTRQMEMAVRKWNWFIIFSVCSPVVVSPPNGVTLMLKWINLFVFAMSPETYRLINAFYTFLFKKLRGFIDLLWLILTILLIYRKHRILWNIPMKLYIAVCCCIALGFLR